MDHHIYRQRAEQLYLQNRHEELRDLSKKMLADAPEYDFALAMYGSALCSLGDREGFKALENALQLEPQEAYYHHLLAYAWSNVREHERALEYIAQAIEISPLNPQYHSFKGEVHYDLGKYESAFEHLDKAIELRPSYTTPYTVKALCYARQGKFEEAEAWIERSFKLEPDKQHTKYAASVIYRLQRDFGKSKETLRDFLGKDPRSRGARAAYIISHQVKGMSLVFVPSMARKLEKVTFTFAAISFGLNLLLLIQKDLHPVYAIAANYITYVLGLYFCLYAFTPLLLVLRLQRVERNSIVQRSNVPLMLAYAGLISMLLAMVTDLVLRTSISHAIYLGLVHLFIYAWYFYRPWLAGTRQRNYAVAYMFICLFVAIGSFAGFLNAGLMALTGLMAPLAVLLLVNCRLFLIEIVKRIMGFVADEAWQ